MDLVQSSLSWIEANPGAAGLVVFVIACVESLVLVGILVPGVAFMMGVGALVGLGKLELMPILVWACVGAVVGDGISFWLGKHYGDALAKLWPMSKYPELMPKGERFFKKHGGKSIIFGRFVGPIRPIIPAIAGMMHMSPARFFVFNVTSAVAWAPVVVLPGVVFGNSMQMAEGVVARLVFICLFLTLVLWVLYRGFKYLLLYWVLPRLENSILSHAYGKLRLDHAFDNTQIFTGIAALSVGAIIMAVTVAAIGPGQQRNPLGQVQAQQWWQGQQLSGFQTDEAEPVNIQIWGDQAQVVLWLQQLQAQPLQVLSPSNVLKYLTPDSNVTDLPVPGSFLFGQSPRFVYALPGVDEKGLPLIKLWPANPKIRADRQQLWLATLVRLPVRRIPMLAQYPGHWCCLDIVQADFLLMLNKVKQQSHLQWKSFTPIDSELRVVKIRFTGQPLPLKP